jgi:hypothetical protein
MNFEAVAHAGGFLEASTTRCSALLLQCDLRRQRRLCCLNSSTPLLPRVLAQGLPPAVPTSYRALAVPGEVPRSTLHARA